MSDATDLASDAAPGPTPTWSVAELAEAVAEQLRVGFPAEVWVRGEIRDLSRARSGHVYFSLHDRAPSDEEFDDGPGAQAQMQVILTAQARTRVNRLLQRSGGAVRMTDGTEVRIRGRLDYYAPRGQLQLRMSSIDPAFTLGQMALERARLVERLRADGLLDRNAALAFPLLPLRVGLVTSGGSAAEADVVHELVASGFAFTIHVHDVRVQGPEAPSAVAEAIASLSASDVDVVLVARGGGAANDLAAFDAESVARAIAAAGVPVVTGVGHETDRSVADEVAHTSAKTPTAAARILVSTVATALERVERAWHQVAVRTVHHLDRAEDRLIRAGQRTRSATGNATRRELERLDRADIRLRIEAGRGLDRAEGDLDRRRTRLADGAGRTLRAADDRLDLLSTRVLAVDPADALRRGWSITRAADGRLVRSPTDAPPGTRLVTTVAAGTVHSVAADPAAPDPPEEHAPT